MQVRQNEKKDIKPRKQKPIKSVPTLKSISKSHTQPKRGERSGLQMDKQFQCNPDPDIFPLRNKCSGAFPEEIGKNLFK